MDETRTGGEPPTLEATVSPPGRSEARAGGRLVAAIIGGILGAVLALVIGWTFGQQIVDGRIRAALETVRPDQTLPVRIAAVEERTTAIDKVAASVDALGGRIGQAETAASTVAATAAALADRVGALEGAAMGPRVDPAVIEELRSRLAAADEAIGRLEARPVVGPSVDLSPLQTAQQDLRTALDQATARLAEQAQAITVLVPRIDTLTTAVAETEQRINERLQATSERLAAAESVLTARATETAQTVATVAALQAAQTDQTAQVAATGRDVAQVRDQLTTVATEVDTRLGKAEQTLNQRLEEALGKIAAQSGRDTATVVTAVALADLGRALQDGAPFGDAVDLLRAHGGGDPALTRAAELLAPVSASGVATRDALSRELAALKPEGAPGAAEGEWWEQTRDNVLGLVSVRREGEVADLPQVRTAGDALAEGDLDAAIRQVEPLAASGGAPVEAWLKRARERRDAEAAVAILREQLGRLAVDAG